MVLGQSSFRSVFPRMLLLVLLLGASGCVSATATYIQAKVTDNPLDRIAQQAQEDWFVERVDANTLHLTGDWPVGNILTLGYSASHAKLFYDETGSVLNIQYYLQSQNVMTLWMPSTLHAEPGIVGMVLKPIMNGQIKDILRWSDASVISRRAGDSSEPFPPKASTLLVPN